MSSYEALSIAEGLIPADYDDQVAAIQHLVNTGEAWTLPGRIGRAASDLIRAGVVTL